MGIQTIAILAVGILGLAIVPPRANAIDTMIPPLPPSTTDNTTPANPPATEKKQDKKTSKKKKKDGNKAKTSDTENFLNGYQAAHALIYRQHRYEAGIAKLKSLGHDDHPDVANLIGYSSRKLGRYDDAKAWYEKALAADPNHARTWSYYGMWHAEQGNLLMARDYLAKVATICGTRCREYTELKGVIEGTRFY